MSQKIILKKIQIQKARLERIKIAYIDGAFSLNDYKEKSKVIENTIKELETKIEEANQCEYFNYSPKDILIKRDIDFISKGVISKEYDSRVQSWSKMTREEKAKLIMNYVDDISLEIIESEYFVSNVNFRESIANPCNELYFNGYIDRKISVLLGNLASELRFSEYLPKKEVGEIIIKLKNFYNVSYTEATYYVKNQVFYFNLVEDNSAIIRIFHLEDYRKLDPDIKMEETEIFIYLTWIIIKKQKI